ncbi:hypothetical protein DVH24_014900 [Malus domestica]|uniref:Uncharacterized protein n=1 Tax=Malus domestica TaxID=3750 RepID=A0A498K1U9_MALDO|nr:hypothetical protein DVH24_014900 [Malus domestica]
MYRKPGLVYSSSSDDNGEICGAKLFGRERPIHHVLGGIKVADVLLWRNIRSSLSSTGCTPAESASTASVGWVGAGAAIESCRLRTNKVHIITYYNQIRYHFFYSIVTNPGVRLHALGVPEKAVALASLAVAVLASLRVLVPAAAPALVVVALLLLAAAAAAPPLAKSKQCPSELV